MICRNISIYFAEMFFTRKFFVINLIVIATEAVRSWYLIFLIWYMIAFLIIFNKWTFVWLSLVVSVWLYCKGRCHITEVDGSLNFSIISVRFRYVFVF